MTGPAAQPSGIGPDAVLAELDAVAARWVPGGFFDRYAGALVRGGGYVDSDAREEASQVEIFMRPAFLRPFLESAAARAIPPEGSAPGIFVLGSGNVGVPLIVNAALGIVAGRTVYARASRANAQAISVWLESLPGGALRDSVVLLELAHDDPAYDARLAALPVGRAFLWGGAEALERTSALLPQVAPRHMHCLGPRTGVLVLECAFWRDQDVAGRRAIAQACYDNLLKFDASLCSSPTLGIALGSPEECRSVLDELVAAMTPEPGETERLARLAGANARRRQMKRWVAQGYSLHQPPGSAVTLALGSVDDYGRKNRFNPPADTFHDSAASLEILMYRPDELVPVAERIAGLHGEPRYQGHLWSVGHVITAAREATTANLMRALEPALAAARGTRVLAARDLRVVDVRNNIGRRPGERADGISLMDAILAD